jgi:predicted phage tail component-like protein
MYGLTYKGINSNTFGLALLSDNRQVLADVVRQIKFVPNYGTVDFGNDTYNEKALTVTLTYCALTLEAMQTQMEQIGGWLYNDGLYHDLIFDDAPLRKYKAKVTSKINLNQGDLIGELSVEFTCNPPYPFALDNSTVSPADVAARLLWDNAANIGGSPIPLNATLKNSLAAFLAGAGNNGGLASFIDASSLQLAFNGSASGNIVNPQFKSTGKNFFNPTQTPSSIANVTLSSVINGGFTLVATVANTACVATFTVKVLNNTAYTFKYNSTRTGATGGGVSLTGYTSGQTNTLNGSFTFTTTSTTLTVSLYAANNPCNVGDSSTYSNIQLEQNSVATAWEQYKQSLLAITGTIGVSDRFTWDGTTGKIDGSATPTSGGLQAYQNGWIFVQNSDGSPATVVPISELTYYQGMTTQMGIEYIKDLTADVAFKFTVGGTHSVLPKITLIGNIPSGLQLAYTASGTTYYWQYSAALQYDGILVDCVAQTVTRLSDGANLYSSVNSAKAAYFSLAAGQNEIDITGTGGAWPLDFIMSVLFTPIP